VFLSSLLLHHLQVCSKILTGISATNEDEASFPISYRLLFTLVNEDPTSTNGIVKWDFPADAMPYLQRFFNEVESFTSIHIESSINYFVKPIDHDKISSSYGERGVKTDDIHHYVTPSQLESFLSTNDWGFGTLTAPRETVYHFLVHIPSAPKSPLHVLKTDDTKRRVKSEVLYKLYWVFQLSIKYGSNICPDFTSKK
jgi:hypothetical protein